jgi:putative ABC transport system permease protein
VKLAGRFRSLVDVLIRRGRFEAGMDDELRFHLETYVDELVRDGIPREEAHRRARLEFGGVEKVKEDCRRARGFQFFDELRQNLRYAFRIMWRSPAFTAVIILTLALGIGANTAIFSLVRGVLLRALPYADADRLVSIWEKNTERERRDKLTGGDYAEWQARNHVFDEMGYSWDAAYTLTDRGDPESLIAYQFSSNFFSVLRAQSLIGRTFTSEDGQPGHDHVVVLSHHLWKSKFGGDTNVLNRVIRLNGDSYTVIGVMPKEFAHPTATVDLWTPLSYPKGLDQNFGMHVFQVVARLKPGMNLKEAQAEMNLLAQQSAREHPNTNRHTSVELELIRQTYVGNIQLALWVLQAAVFFMLLIACGNAGNMLLARATASEREVAVRAALGAGRWRLLRQYFTQGLFLSACSAVLGILFAYWGVGILPELFRRQLAVLPLPNEPAAWLDWPVLGFAVAIAAFVALIFGTIPALRGSIPSQEDLRAGGRGTTERQFAIRLRSALIVGQVALSLLLLVGSGLLLRSFLKLQDQSLGFQPHHVLSFVLQFPANRYPGLTRTASSLGQMLSGIREIPGVDSAAFISTLPLSGMDARRPYFKPDDPAGRDQQQMVQYRVITPDYFRAMNIPLKKGRFFDESDRQGSRDVVIISDKFARELWPDADPVGRMINVGDLMQPEPREIVGVVGDVRHQGLGTEPPIEVYRPAYQVAWPFFGAVVRSTSEPAPVVSSVRAAVWAVDKDLPIDSIRTMDDLAIDSVGLRRTSMQLLGLFAGLAVLLASAGIYSMISYSVTVRRHEVGIRIALGARRADVLRTVLGHTAVLTISGLAIGLVASWGLTRFLASLLFNVSPTDTVTLVLAILALAFTAVCAAYFPVRRAFRIDPNTALRYE